MRFTIAVWLLSLSVLLNGCSRADVGFTDLRPLPTATVSNNVVTIHLGKVVSAAGGWTIPKVDLVPTYMAGDVISGYTIYVTGQRSDVEQSTNFVVRVPASTVELAYSIVWVDPGKTNIMLVPITE